MARGYRRSEPPRLFVVLLAAVLVFGCYAIWNGTVDWIASSGDAQVAATQAEIARQRANPSNTPIATFQVLPTRTEVPACQIFEINAESGTVRECPDFSCTRVETLYYQDTVCVYGRAQDDTYLASEEWYVIDRNPQGAFRDLAYIHESVVEAANPTARPTRTFTPLPTITLTPTPRPGTATITPTLPLPPTTEVPLPTPSLVRQQF